MTDQALRSVEERLAVVETELKLLKDWRRRAIRSVLLGLGGIAIAIVVVVRAAPVNGSTMPVTIQQHPTVEAPFTVVNSSGRKLFEVVQNEGGGASYLYNYYGAKVAGVGANKRGDGGAIDLLSADQKAESLLSAAASGPALNMYVGGSAIATLSSGSSNTVRSILQLNNAQGAAAQLLVSNDSGKLILADAATSIRVEAGTETNGYGSVKVSGPTGKCIPAIPCMLVGH